MSEVRQWPQFKLRMPPELRDWLEQRSTANHRSQTSELVFILQQERQREHTAKVAQGAKP